MAPLEKALNTMHSGLSSQTNGDTGTGPDGNSSRNGGNKSISDASSSDSSGSANVSGVRRSSSNTSSSSPSRSTRRALSGHDGDGGASPIDPSEAQDDAVHGDRDSQAHAQQVRSGGLDAASAVEPNEEDHGGAPQGRQCDAWASSAPSSAVRRKLSDASVASVASRGGGRDRQTSRGVSMNTTNEHANARLGQLSRSRSTRSTTPGSRVEVRGELEIMNVSSAEEVVHLLEDTTSPLALHLQNVELRVGPGQSVRLGEAVPALREHLRHDLERRLREEGTAGREGRPSVLTGERHIAQRSGTNVSSSSRGSNIMLTGTVIGGVHPRLLSSRIDTAGTAKAPAAPKALSLSRRGAAVSGEPMASRTLLAVSGAGASDAAASESAAADAAGCAAARSAPMSAAVAEQTQQERASAEAASLVQQILEVQGQVKSLLAEEGLSSVTAETAALKKKKGALDGQGNNHQLAREREGSTRRCTDGDTRSGREERTISDSSRGTVSTSSSGSSSSRTFPRASDLPKVMQPPQQSMTGTAMARDFLINKEAQADVFTSSQRPEKANLAAGGASHFEKKEQETASGEPRSTEGAGGGTTTESIQVQQGERQDKRGQSGKREPGELEERRRKGRTSTHSAEAEEVESAKTTLHADEADTGESYDRERAANESFLTAHSELSETDTRRHGESIAEEKLLAKKALNSSGIREAAHTAAGATQVEHGMTRYDKPASVFPKTVEAERVEFSEPERKVNETNAPKNAESKPPSKGQTAEQRQTGALTEEQVSRSLDKNLPQMEGSQELKKYSSKEADNKAAESPRQKKVAAEAEEAKEGFSRESPYGTSAMEIKAKEECEGGRSDKPDKRESGISAEDANAATATPAPTFAQTWSNFFSWGGAEEESQPPSVSKNGVEVKTSSNRGNAETERDRIERSLEPVEQVGPKTFAKDTEAGRGGLEEQSKQKKRPKLQPKAPPAGVALSKRDKDLR